MRLLFRLKSNMKTMASKVKIDSAKGLQSAHNPRCPEHTIIRRKGIFRNYPQQSDNAVAYVARKEE